MCQWLQPYLRTSSVSANQSSVFLVSSGLATFTIVDLLCVSKEWAIEDRRLYYDSVGGYSQAANASSPFSRPIPLSFIPPLRGKMFISSVKSIRFKGVQHTKVS